MSAVTLESGRIFARENPSRGETYVQVLARLGEKFVEVVAATLRRLLWCRSRPKPENGYEPNAWWHHVGHQHGAT